MTNVEIIKDFYSFENFRNLAYVDQLVDENCLLEWNSSVGQFIYNKVDIMKLTKELFENYSYSNIEIDTIFGQDNHVAVRYKYYASTIENPSEVILITKIMVIWEFKNGKIIKGYQSSVVE